MTDGTFKDVAIVWSGPDAVCWLAAAGDRYRVYVVRGTMITQAEDYSSPDNALAAAWRWRHADHTPKVKLVVDQQMGGK